MLVPRRLLEAKLYLTTNSTFEFRGNVKCEQATDFTKSSFLL
jgi:hypothetical protein